MTSPRPALPSAPRHLAVGSWQLAVGSWQLASWQLAVGSWHRHPHSQLHARLRIELRRPLPMSYGAGDGDVGELFAGGGASEQEAAAAHVSASHEFRREHQSGAEDILQHVDILR